MTALDNIGGPDFPMNVNPITVWQAAVRDKLNTLENAAPPPQVRVTRPNIDDRLVETWNGTGWSVTGYDSGWRDVTSLLSDGFEIVSGIHLLARLANGLVQIRGYVNATETPAGTVAFCLWPFGPAQGLSLPTFVWSITSPGTLTYVYGPEPSAALKIGGGINEGDRTHVVATFKEGAPTSYLFASIDVPFTNAVVPTSLPGSLFTPAP